MHVDVAAYKAFMVALYEQAIPEQKDPYFREYLETQIANEATVDRYIRGFELIAPWLRPGVTALEWGCRQGFMSCLIHRHLEGDVTLHGCDVVAGDFERFYRTSSLEFTLLDHEWELPYDSGSFDFVVANGVLEHVANEYESTKEIHRVLKPDGIFAITFLPNRYAISENLRRMLGFGQLHNRLYRRSQASHDFLRRGFLIEACGYHQVLPSFAHLSKRSRATNAIGNASARLNRPLEPIWPVNRLSSNLYFVLRRVDRM
jgi:SAM-dependent methyltransferase